MFDADIQFLVLRFSFRPVFIPFTPLRFFLEQNNHIFQTLMDVSESQDKALTTDHMKAMGLDPVGDRQFIMDLVELYGIDVILMVDNPCCPV